MKTPISFSVFSTISAQTNPEDLPLCHTRIEDAECIQYEESSGESSGEGSGDVCVLYESVLQDVSGGIFGFHAPYNGNDCRVSLSLPGCRKFQGVINGVEAFQAVLVEDYEFDGGEQLSLTLTCRDIDCFDGNNGGCSHFCNSENGEHFCECPRCWESDGYQTCKPEAGRIRTACGAEFMAVDVDKCLFHDKSLQYGISERLNLRWDSWMSDCSRVRENNDLSVETSRSMTTRLDNCGTTVTQEGDEIVFRNKIISGSRFNDFNIVLDNAAELSIECRYNTNVSTNSAMIEVESMAVTGGAVGYGNFAFNAQYYQDNTFSMPADSNNVVIVGEQLYLAIEPIAIVDGVKWYITDCTIYDDININNRKFPVVADRCPNPMVVNSYNSFLNTHSFEMSYTAFQFEFEGALSESQAELFVSCEVVVCLDGKCPSDPSCE